MGNEVREMDKLRIELGSDFVLSAENAAKIQEVVDKAHELVGAVEMEGNNISHCLLRRKRDLEAALAALPKERA